MDVGSPHSVIPSKLTVGGCIVGLCASLALGPQPVRAAGEETTQGESEEWAEEGLNDLGLFLGVTHAYGESGFSVGLDYERRLSRRFGIGGVIEYTDNDFRDGIAAVSVKLAPVEGAEAPCRSRRGGRALRTAATASCFASARSTALASARASRSRRP